MVRKNPPRARTLPVPPAAAPAATQTVVMPASPNAERDLANRLAAAAARNAPQASILPLPETGNTVAAPQHPVAEATAHEPMPQSIPVGGLAAAAIEETEEEQAEVSDRPPMREEMRARDPRAAAAERAKQIMGHLPDTDAGVDEFYFDPAKIPDGWVYEWKRFLVYNQPDPAYEVAIAQTGWEPVPRERHPEEMPKGSTSATIDRKGMRLMERPKEINDMFIERDDRLAREQVRVKEEQLAASAPGQFERGTHPQTKPRVSKSYEPMPVPKGN